MTTDNILLEVTNLKKYFPVRKGIFKRIAAHVKAVDDIDLYIKKGETLALSGLLQNFDAKAVDAVPGLGKLPVLGYLFKSEKFQRGETEAVIFITPDVITPDSEQSQDMIGGILSEYEQPLE